MKKLETMNYQFKQKMNEQLVDLAHYQVIKPRLKHVCGGANPWLDKPLNG